MFVYLEGFLDLCQLIWGVSTLVVVGSTQGNPRGGVEILTAPPPALGWIVPLWQAACLLFPSGTRVTGPH